MKKTTALLLTLVICIACISSCAPGTTDNGVSRPTTTQDTQVTPVPSGSDTAEATKAPEVTTAPATTAEPDSHVSGQLYIPTDLSFLDSVNKGSFTDVSADDTRNTWYPGKITRDAATGVETVHWDRSPDTLAILDKYNAIYRGNRTTKKVYLTFDCGYEYRNDEYPDGVTNDILDTLKEKDAPGTFFVTGDYLKSDSDIVKRMLDEGHIVGTHTLHHYNMTTITPEEFVEEIKGNNDLLKEKVPGAPDMIFYRPPEGGANEWTLALADKMGLYTTFWSITQYDYDTANQPDPAAALQSDEEKLHSGAVYLLHAVSTTNAKILGDLIDYIRGQGFEICPLDEFER